MPSVHRMITLIIHTSHMRDWNSTSALMVLLCGTVATHSPVRLTRTQPVMFTSRLCCPSGEGQRGQLQKIGIKQPLLDLYDWMNSPKGKKQELKRVFPFLASVFWSWHSRKKKASKQVNLPVEEKYDKLFSGNGGFLRCHSPVLWESTRTQPCLASSRGWGMPWNGLPQGVAKEAACVLWRWPSWQAKPWV